MFNNEEIDATPTVGISGGDQTNQRGSAVELFFKAALFLGKTYYSPETERRRSLPIIETARLPSLSFLVNLGNWCTSS